MTANQIAYWQFRETERANREKEKENTRSNRAREEETNRHNVADEQFDRGKLRVDTATKLGTQAIDKMFANADARVKASGNVLKSIL